MSMMGFAYNSVSTDGEGGVGLGLIVIPGRCEASNPESRDSPVRNCAPEVCAKWRIPE